MLIVSAPNFTKATSFLLKANYDIGWVNIVKGHLNRHVIHNEVWRKWKLVVLFNYFPSTLQSVLNVIIECCLKILDRYMLWYVLMIFILFKTSVNTMCFSEITDQPVGVILITFSHIWCGIWVSNFFGVLLVVRNKAI